MVVVPLLFCAIVSGAAGMSRVAKLGGIVARSMIYFLCTTAIAVATGLLVANGMQPGAGVETPAGVSGFEYPVAPGLVITLLNIIPLNPFEAMAKGNMLQVLFFAMVLGFVLSATGERAATVRAMFEEMNTLMIRLVNVIMHFAPVGVFAMLAYTTASFGVGVLLQLGKLILAVYIAAVVHVIVIYFPLLKVCSKVSFREYARVMAEPLVLAFSTCSSVAALPANLIAAHKLGAKKKVASFSIPLGTTINMDGASLYLEISARANPIFSFN